MSMSASLYDVGTGGSTTTFTGVNGVVDETAGTREITGTFTISFGNVTTKRLHMMQVPVMSSMSWCTQG